MKRVLFHTYKILRNVVVAALLLFLTFYTTLYIVLSIPAVQDYARSTAEEELSKLFATKVTIGELRIDPISKVALYDVNVPDQQGKKMIHVDRIGAGISLGALLFKQRIVFSYAEVIALDGCISKATPEGKMNIQFLIDALSPKDKTKPPTKFDLRLEAVVIRKSNLSYDVLSEPQKAKGIFDKNHISITDINTDITVPDLRNNYFTIDVRRLAFKEQSGFELRNLTTLIHIDNNHIDTKVIDISFPQSHIIINPIHLTFEDLKSLDKDINNLPLTLDIKDATISLSDFRAFAPILKKFQHPVYLTIKAEGTINDFIIEKLHIRSENEWLTMNCSATIKHPLQREIAEIYAPDLQMNVVTTNLAKVLVEEGLINQKIADRISTIRYMGIDGNLNYAAKKADYRGTIATGIGKLITDGTFRLNDKGSSFAGCLRTDNLQLGKFLANNNIGDIAFDIDTDMLISGGKPKGIVKGVVNKAVLKGYEYHDITADLSIDNNSYEGLITLKDENADIEISGMAVLDKKNTKIEVEAHTSGMRLHQLNLIKKYPDHALSFDAFASFSGNTPDTAEGDIEVSNISFIDNNGEGLLFDRLQLVARTLENGKKSISINSDLLNGNIDGDIRFASIVKEVKDIVSVPLPSLIAPGEDLASTATNNFTYSFTIEENDDLTEFFHLPITVVHPITIKGRVDAINNSLAFNLDAPYLLQKKNIIEKTGISLNVDKTTQTIQLNASTQFDHKNGNILLLLNSFGTHDRLDTDIDWNYDRRRDFSGRVSISSLFSRADDNRLLTDIDINPSHFSVNDTIWTVEPAKIHIDRKTIHIADINVNRDNQFVKAEGTVSTNAEDTLTLKLQNIDLDYIFETLRINNVVFGGSATGTFYASSLLGGAPNLNTPNLHVKQLSYQHATLGDADIESHWNNDTKGIHINADINQKNGRMTYVRGAVYPTRDSLNFKFDADHVNIQILKPFMSAFTTEMEGEASGHAELYGTFKFINMKGRLFADRFRMRVDQTGCYYSVSDSVRIDEGIIRINNAKIIDDYGNTARLNGTITHQYFKNASFNFAITDVNNMLCYNTTEKDNPYWYGKIYGNGSAFIDGKPGNVKIDVNMSAAPRSSFTFVVSDKEEASEYNFVTFTDRRREEQQRREQDNRPEFLKLLQTNLDNKAGSTAFNINLLVNANPNVSITLVMDPEGGDRIRATGNGNLRIEYDSADGMKMFGNYTADEGRYNFTLQDIIVREFRLKQGAQITFNGDPLEAILDLSATYSLNANLQDLDESFSSDKDLNRTLVPVNAVLNLRGALTQPDISFDLEFPTLTQDVYRKVRSIISTDDMMNQQMIYLLALNRFYTPEYMGGTNRSNELAAVASSTISSQLSSILGQLNDNWTIAPNFRSDKGDFSDTEVELALSSHLLNNRLLLNGNFGYSDTAMNNNSFIGDFDIEYLLTKNGNIRLKAYNRYNDQNYYIRNALTTQGVGVMFKYDFDNLFHRKKRQPESTDSLPSVPEATIVPGDSIKRLPIKQSSNK
ncbi:MAG: translocation/assembly module TamB domain-containing protein [Candidatus Limisoma sp.]